MGGKRIGLPRVVTCPSHGFNDLVCNIGSINTPKRPRQPAGNDGMTAFKEASEDFGCVFDSCEHDLRLDGIPGEEIVRHPYQRGGRSKEAQTVFDQKVAFRRHVFLFEVV